jgi:pyruvate,water dikinase
MLQALKDEGVRVPGGFATTAQAYWEFLEENDLKEKIAGQLKRLREEEGALESVGKKIRRLFYKASFPERIAKAITEAYRQMNEEAGVEEVDVAVRSSATAEDLPEASFAGQQETFLNITGEDELLEASKKCFASLFTDRAISYREEKNFNHLDIALSVGVQKMVRADKSGSGVMFSLDPESGYPDVVVIDASWGLGENVVQGTVNPDEYVVFKPHLDEDDLVPIVGKDSGLKQKKMVYSGGGSHTTKNVDTTRKEQDAFVLSDEEIVQLARWACRIEKHYEKPMDMEWAKDGEDNQLYIVQARPETVQSRRESSLLRTYRLKEEGEVLTSGSAIGSSIAVGKAHVIHSPEEGDEFEADEILVTGMTDPDWGPIIKKAGGIITDHGGRTSHAAIVSRELGIPAVVGCGDATESIENGLEVTLSCAEGEEGRIYKGKLEYETEDLDLESISRTKTAVMMNLSNPQAALRWWRLPAQGVGLARTEFIIGNLIKIHPMALAHFDDLEDKEARKEIKRLTRIYDDMKEYFVDRFALGVARIAIVQEPDPVIVRMSDFKTNEYASLIGGRQIEPAEENPMLGFRGASRYYSDAYRDGFALECQAIKRVRERIGLKNVAIMIPFCRTVEEADQVLEVLADNGLVRGEDGLEVYVMSELPANVMRAVDLAKRFDGFSIGSNDLTQLMLGVDRDSSQLASIYDENNPAVKEAIREVIRDAHESGSKVGFCGQAPSDDPAYAEFLVRSGIDSISVTPDSVLQVKRRVYEIENRMQAEGQREGTTG